MSINFCPYCNGGLREIIRHGAPTQGSASHYSRIECIECGRFVRWGKAPHTVARLQVWKAKVQKLAECKNLNQWQAQFVASVTERLDEGKGLSPKQQEWLNKIYQEVGFDCER